MFGSPQNAIANTAPTTTTAFAPTSSAPLSSSSSKMIDPTDCSVPSPGTDGISSLTWSPTSNLLVSSNWDSSVSCWEVQQQQQPPQQQYVAPGGQNPAGGQCQAMPKAQVRHDGGSPVLDTCFSADGGTVFSCGADKAVRMWQLNDNLPSGSVPQQIGVHDAVVRHVRFLPHCNNGQGLVVSGGWDRKLKFWDVRSPTPAGILELSERVYALDARGDLLVVGTADRQIYSYDVGNNASGPREISRAESPLKFMTRCLSVFPDHCGFAVGSIEGRVGIHYVRQVPGKESFAFKCHRQESNVYSVNGIAFNHPYGTFATIGSDGVVTFWDKDNKQRLKAFPQLERTISCAAFNATGTLFAYASSYDWSKGSGYVQAGNEIFVHVVQENEVKPKAKKSNSSGGYKR